MTPKQRQSLRTSAVRDLVYSIAQEAHMMGRLYAASGEKLNPADEWMRIYDMADASLKRGRITRSAAPETGKERDRG